MIWDEAGISPTGGRFAVQLTEDLKATDGAIALPSGTVLITQVDNVTRSNRLVSQSVVALVYPDSSGRIHQVPIPPGNLLIRGEDNQALIAEGLFDKATPKREQNLLVANNQTLSLADIERGLEVAIRRGYTTANDPVVSKVREFLALTRNGTNITTIERTNLSMSVVISLAKLGLSDIPLSTQTI